MQQCLTFGLPVGSALVLLALINSVFVLHSVENFAEVVIIKGFDSASGDGFIIVSLIVSVLMALNIWAFVIIKGSRTHLSFWIGVYLVIVLIHSIISIQSLSIRHYLFWPKLWNLIVSLVIDFYVISVGAQCINLMWKKSHPSHVRDSSIVPVGNSVDQIIRFYKENCGLAVRMLLMLDITWSTITLLSIKLPLLIFKKNEVLPAEGFGIQMLSTIDDVFLRLSRIVLSLIAFRLIANQTQPSVLRRVVIGHLILTGMSVAIYFLQSFQLIFFDMSVSETFQSFNCLVEMMFRLLIAFVFLRHIEGTEMTLDVIPREM